MLRLLRLLLQLVLLLLLSCLASRQVKTTTALWKNSNNNCIKWHLNEFDTYSSRGSGGGGGIHKFLCKIYKHSCGYQIELYVCEYGWVCVYAPTHVYLKTTLAMAKQFQLVFHSFLIFIAFEFLFQLTADIQLDSDWLESDVDM